MSLRMQKNRVITLFGLAKGLLLLAVLGLQPGDSAVAAPLTGEGLIALTLRDAVGRLQIFTIHPDGRGRKQLTDEGQNGIPAGSRDGKKLAFMSIRDNRVWVAVMEADGS